MHQTAVVLAVQVQSAIRNVCTWCGEAFETYREKKGRAEGKVRLNSNIRHKRLTSGFSLKFVNTANHGIEQESACVRPKASEKNPS